MVELILILLLGGVALVLSAKNDVLKQENKGLRDRIKRDKRWAEMDKKKYPSLLDQMRNSR